MLFSIIWGESITPALQHGHESHFAVLFLSIVFSLNHAVGENDQPVASLQRHRP